MIALVQVNNGQERRIMWISLKHRWHEVFLDENVRRILLAVCEFGSLNEQVLRKEFLRSLWTFLVLLNSPQVSYPWTRTTYTYGRGWWRPCCTHSPTSASHLAVQQGIPDQLGRLEISCNFISSNSLSCASPVGNCSYRSSGASGVAFDEWTNSPAPWSSSASTSSCPKRKKNYVIQTMMSAPSCSSSCSGSRLSFHFLANTA